MYSPYYFNALEYFLFQATFEKLENELKEVNANAVTLKRNFLELTELKYVLQSSQIFFAEVSIFILDVIKMSKNLEN